MCPWYLPELLVSYCRISTGWVTSTDVYTWIFTSLFRVGRGRAPLSNAVNDEERFRSVSEVINMLVWGDTCDESQETDVAARTWLERWFQRQITPMYNTRMKQHGKSIPKKYHGTQTSAFLFTICFYSMYLFLKRLSLWIWGGLGT